MAGPAATTVRAYQGPLQGLSGRRVLLTGAHGRLGPHLAAELEEAGALVTSPTSGELDLSKPDIELRRALERLEGAEPFDIVLNFAAISRGEDAKRDPKKALFVNLGACRTMIEYLVPRRTRLVLVSSVRTLEPQEGPYSWTKLGVEGLAATTPPDAGVVCVRLGNVVPPEVTGEPTNAFEAAITHLRSILRSDPPSAHLKMQLADDYFMPLSAVSTAVAFALRKEGGSIITPRLDLAPVPFMMGLMAGWVIGSGSRLDGWTAEYDTAAKKSRDLLPQWWWEYTSMESVETRVDDVTQETLYFVTHFGRTVDVERRPNAKSWAPRFGSFGHSLQLERHL